MVESAMRELRTLPKVDLHVHLEGPIRPLTLAEVSDRVGSLVPGGLRDGRWAFAGFDDFIAQYDALDACLGGLDDLRRYAYEFCEDERREGVQYAEVTMTPAGHARCLGSWEGPLEAVLDGFEAGDRDFGITCQLVLDIARGVPLEWAHRRFGSGLCRPWGCGPWSRWFRECPTGQGMRVLLR